MRWVAGERVCACGHAEFHGYVLQEVGGDDGDNDASPVQQQRKKPSLSRLYGDLGLKSTRVVHEQVSDRLTCVLRSGCSSCPAVRE